MSLKYLVDCLTYRKFLQNQLNGDARSRDDGFTHHDCGIRLNECRMALLHETGSAVLASWFFGLRFFCNRIGLGFGQREQSVKHRTTHPCFGLLVR